MKNITYNNKNYLGVKEGIVPPAPQYLWINSEDNKLYKFGNTGWEPIRDEVLKGFTAEQIEEILNSIENKVDKEPGKGLSTNDYTNEDKAQVAKNTLDIAKKANTTEYYPSMAVGVADNLRGRGEATEEYFTYRPSAGASNSISEEGVATMKRIKGNSVVWNQLMRRFVDSHVRDGITYERISPMELYVHGTAIAGVNVVPLGANVIFKRDGSKYYVSLDVEGPTSHTYGVNGYSLSNNKPFIWYANADTDWDGTVAISLPAGTIIDCVFRNLQVTNLTQMFGAGNEPSTIEEFYASIPEGVDINAYNEGQLISMNANAIETTGYNQFNGVVMDGYIDDANGEHVITTRYKCTDYISVLPNQEYYINSEQTGTFWGAWYDSDKKFINGISFYDNEPLVTSPTSAAYLRMTILAQGSGGNPDTYCINLSHSGVRNGEYEPYKEHTQDLLEIALYFPDGMKSVGGVFDEINEHEAVQRVGQRAYADGDNDNPAVRTDGVNTIYPLDEPIVTPMPARAINLNYPVWDWGTERAVSDVPSAPFRADIIYGFNAVDTIRTNKLNIEDILRRLAELEAKTVVEQSVEE